VPLKTRGFRHESWNENSRGGVSKFEEIEVRSLKF